MRKLIFFALALSTSLSFAQTQYSCHIYKRLGEKSGKVMEIKDAQISTEKKTELLLPDNKKITTDFTARGGNLTYLRVLFYDDSAAFYASSRVDAIFQNGQQVISAGTAFERNMETSEWLQNLWVYCTKK